MQRNAVCWAAVTLAGFAMFSAGCQFTGFRSAQREPADHQRPLNGREVAEVQLSLARSLEIRGETESALNAYRQAVEKDPRRATGYWRMAVIQDRKGKVEESGALYQQALKLEPKNPDLLCDYGYSMYLQRRWAEAEERLQQAIALKPKHPRAHNNLGLVLAQTERSDEALAEFRKAGCHAADARINLAFVMTLNRRWDQARQQYELALDANPDSTAARTGLENLETVVAKASPRADRIELTNYEDSTTGRPARVAPRIKLKTSPVSLDTTGRAALTTSPDAPGTSGRATISTMPQVD